MQSGDGYILIASTTYKKILTRLKSRDLGMVRAIDRGVEKILTNPMLGKPLRHGLRNFRRVHIAGSFVLLFEVSGNEVRLIDFDHHDRIYKKYS